MAAKLGLFLALNILFFATAVHGCTSYCAPSDPPPPVEPASPTYVPEPPAPATPTPPAPSTYAPEPPAPTSPATGHWCPVNALELQVCASVLDGLVKVSLPEDGEKCCRLLAGLADIDAAACLCTVLRADVLGIPLRVPIDISLSLNRCGHRNCPPGLTCPR